MNLEEQFFQFLKSDRISEEFKYGTDSKILINRFSYNNKLDILFSIQRYRGNFFDLKTPFKYSGIYDKENNKINLKQELLNDNITNKFVLSISDVLNKIVSNVDEMIIDNHVSEDKNTMTTKVNVICKNNITISYISTTEITDNISTSNDYEQSKKIILNDLTKEQLQKLYNAIINNIKGIYQDKKALISNN